jgi:hypothetical protein
MSDIAAVIRHYSSEGIAGRVLEALHTGSGAATAVTPHKSLAPLDHFHSGALHAIREMPVWRDRDFLRMRMMSKVENRQIDKF